MTRTSKFLTADEFEINREISMTISDENRQYVYDENGVRLIAVLNNRVDSDMNARIYKSINIPALERTVEAIFGFGGGVKPPFHKTANRPLKPPYSNRISIKIVEGGLGND